MSKSTDTTGKPETGKRQALHQRARKIALWVVMLIGLSSLGGCGGRESYERFHDSTYGYSVQVPPAWAVVRLSTDSQAGTNGIDPRFLLVSPLEKDTDAFRESLGVEVVPVDTGITSKNCCDAYLAWFRSQTAELKIHESGTREIDGLSVDWVEMSAGALIDYTVAIVYFIVSDSMLLRVVCTADSHDALDRYRDVFESAVDSFHFGQ